MSNLLHRLAATLHTSRPRLQPMLGSIFAPSFAARDELVGSAPVAATSGEDTPFTARSTASSDIQPWHSPLLPQFSPSPLAGVEPSTAAHLEPAHDPSPGPENAATRPYAAGRDERPASPAALHLIAAAAQPLLGAQPPAFLPPQPPRAAALRAPPINARSTPARAPDDIHIHIGRIEVSAIAPPAPAPRPAAPRRSLSLDEYLQRGNRPK